MKVYIPIAIGQHVPPSVLDGLNSQTLPVDIVVVGTPGIVDSSRWPGRSKHIARNREIIAKLARLEGQTAAMCDSDVVHLMKDNLALAEEFLKKNPLCGAVSFRPLKHKSHVLIGSVVVSPEAWGLADFGNGDECNCRSFEKSIAPYLSVVYLDGNIRIKEIPRTYDHR